jgi:Ribonuclease G/E
VAVKVPDELAAGGRALWRAVVDAHDLDAAQLVQLQEACRAKDRLDKLDQLMRGEGDLWVRVARDARNEGCAEIKFDGVLSAANNTANLMKQLLTALRLPDEATGKRPQYRGPRGAQKPSVPGGKGSVTALDRFRAASGG